MSEKRLYLTGASGLLGRAIYKKFVAGGWDVYGTAFSRITGQLHKVDLNDKDCVEKSVQSFKPTIIIHCAAQRFPDKVESDPSGAEKLNVIATKHIAEIGASISVPVLYISTDYVFDGLSSPYKENDKPHPLNLYGEMKLNGEKEVLKINSNNIVLRIPVLYGPVEYLSESAVTVLLQTLLNKQSSKISDYEKRCPSHVDDVAEICFELACKKLQDNTLEGIYHWCGKEKFTKFGMVSVMAQVFNLPCDHILPAPDAPNSATPRPYDTTLNTSKLKSLGICYHTKFSEGIYSALKNWVK